MLAGRCQTGGNDRRSGSLIELDHDHTTDNNLRGIDHDEHG